MSLEYSEELKTINFPNSIAKKTFSLLSSSPLGFWNLHGKRKAVFKSVLEKLLGPLYSSLITCQNCKILATFPPVVNSLPVILIKMIITVCAHRFAKSELAE